MDYHCRECILYSNQSNILYEIHLRIIMEKRKRRTTKESVREPFELFPAVLLRREFHLRDTCKGTIKCTLL